MTRPFAALALLLVLLAPSAAAWPWDPVEIEIPALRVGDLLRFEGPYDSEGRTRTDTILVEGPSRATDRFGIERDTLALRTDRSIDGAFHRSTRCHQLAASFDAVRGELLAGDPQGWSSSSSTYGGGLGGIEATRQEDKNTTMTVGFANTCMMTPPLGARTLREGDTLSVADIEADWKDVPGLGDARSLPALVESFHGRVALRFTFDIREAMKDISPEEQPIVSILFADGFPTYVEQRIDEPEARVASTLTGFTPGAGAPVTFGGSASLPDRHPGATFVPYDAHRLDDSKLSIAVHYADAYAAMVADPNEGARMWFNAHPDASLLWAIYEAGTQEVMTAGPRATTHTWTLTFVDGDIARTWMITRYDDLLTPLGPTALPQQPFRVSATPEFSDTMPHGALPAETIDGAGLAELVRTSGVKGEIQFVHYLALAFGDTPYLTLSIDDIDRSVPQSEGHGAEIDPVTGGLRGAGVGTFRASDTVTILPAAQDPTTAGGPSSLGALAPLSTPGGIGTVAAAATGLGLLGLLIKFLLVPLFTRLRRDRLLDNAVRARLYERIRAEPGIHRAELVDFAGIGEGATRHHLTQLVKHHLLVESAADGFVRYFAAGEVPREVALRESILRAGSHRAVYELYAREPALTLREAGARLQMSAPSVHRAKKRLTQAGLLPVAGEATVASA